MYERARVLVPDQRTMLQVTMPIQQILDRVWIAEIYTDRVKTNDSEEMLQSGMKGHQDPAE